MRRCPPLHSCIPVLAASLVLLLAGALRAQAPAAMAARNPTPAPGSETDAWVDSLKKPCDYFKWGADLRLRQEYLLDAITLSDNNTAEKDRERDFQRYRLRLWGTFMDPKDLVEANVRLTTEPRYYFQPWGQDKVPSPVGRPYFPEEFYASPIFFDTLNATVNKIGDLPLKLVLGRQDFLDDKGRPLYGDGWLILDGTPLDGSRSSYFDALRASLPVDSIDTTFDLIYIDQGGHDTHWLPTIGVKHEDQIEQNERGAILWVKNKSLKDTTLDGFFIYKHSTPTSNLPYVAANGAKTYFYWNAGNYFVSYPDEGDMYALGGKVAHTFDEHWTASMQAAWEFGQNRGMALDAFGAVSRVNYAFNDSLKNQVHAGYEYLSGDSSPGSPTDTAWKPLWGRWPQWSELYVYTYAPETRIGEVTNLHRINVGWQFEPAPRLQFLVDYHALFADKTAAISRSAPVGPFIDGDGSFRGHLITAKLIYKFNRYATGHLWGEFFIPGGYYTSGHRDTGLFLRAEIAFTF
jgi:hypothetical protein